MTIIHTPDALLTQHNHACDSCGRTNEGELPLIGWKVYRGVLVCGDECAEQTDQVAAEVSGEFMPLGAALASSTTQGREAR